MIDRYRTYQPRYQQARKPKRHYGRFFALACLLAAMLVVGKTAAKQLLAEEKNVTKSSTSQKSKPRIKADPIASTTWNDLSQQINAVIAEHGDLDISVAIIDIATNTSANYGIQDSFAGASTTKVLTAAAYLDAVENGERKLTASINGTTAKQQISNMTNQSDNNAWAALNQNLSYTTIEEYAASIGITSYKAKNNVITASDEALLLQKLYQRALLNEENTTLLLSYMQETNNEAMIPQVIPEGAALYHKYGQLEDRLHDAAIVDYQDRPISLVIYTKGGATDGSNYQSRVALIRTLAQTVFGVIYADASQQ